MAAADTELLEKVGKDILVTLSASKDPIPLTEFNVLFSDDHCYDIPVAKFGFSSLKDFFETIPDYVAVVTVNGTFCAKYVPCDALKSNRSLIMRTDYDTTKEPKPRPKRAPAQSQTRARVTKEKAPAPVHVPLSVPAQEEELRAAPRAANQSPVDLQFSKIDFISLVRKWNEGSKVLFEEIAKKVKRSEGIDLNDIGTLRKVLHATSNNRAAAINTACKNELKAISEGGKLVIYISESSSSSNGYTSTTDMSSTRSSSLSYADETLRPSSYLTSDFDKPSGSVSSANLRYGYDFENVDSAASESQRAQDDLQRLYESGDPFVEVNTDGDVDEREQQVLFLIDTLGKYNISLVITDIPALLSRHFNVNPEDFKQYDHALIDFVQELIDRSDSMLMFKYLNNVHLLTLSVHHNNSVRYSTLPIIDTPDMLRAADDCLCTEMIDLGTNEDALDAVRREDFWKHRQRAKERAAEESQERCSVM